MLCLSDCGPKSLNSALKKFISIRVICAALKDTLFQHFGHRVVIESEHIFHVFSLKLGPAFAGPFLFKSCQRLGTKYDNKMAFVGAILNIMQLLSKSK